MCRKFCTKSDGKSSLHLEHIIKCLIFFGVVKMFLRKIKRMELIVSQCLSRAMVNGVWRCYLVESHVVTECPPRRAPRSL